jgi:cell fate regulator YaaT (PSP1 superfamily)
MTYSDEPQANPAGPSEGAPPQREARPARVVRYGAMGRVGEFACRPGSTFGCHQQVVVQTERGIELGELVGSCAVGGGCERAVTRPQLQEYVRNSGQEFCLSRAGRILRAATEQDINEHRHLNAKIHEDVDYCAELAYQLNLDMKIVTAEHLLGGERIVFYFGSATRVDFRQLVKELAQRYRTRIEMRQVKPRDEARLVADYEVCGRECCCRGFLKKLRSVNMKMAKLQKSTLDPSKVSGRCGRLRCCLRYEHLGYEELAERLPRVGTRVRIAAGAGVVVDRQILTQLVAIHTDDDHDFVVPLDEIREFNLPPAPPPSAAPPPPAPPPPPRPAPAAEPGSGPPGERPRRRRRGRRTNGPRPAGEPPAPDASALVESRPDSAPPPAAADAPTDPSAPAGERRSRRRRRGRRRRPGERDPGGDHGAAGPSAGDGAPPAE